MLPGNEEGWWCEGKQNNGRKLREQVREMCKDGRGKEETVDEGKKESRKKEQELIAAEEGREVKWRKKGGK